MIGLRHTSTLPGLRPLSNSISPHRMRLLKSSSRLTQSSSGHRCTTSPSLGGSRRGSIRSYAFGKTIAYAATEPQGLLNGKKIVVITSRGGSYSADLSGAQFDFQESYLRRILIF